MVYWNTLKSGVFEMRKFSTLISLGMAALILSVLSFVVGQVTADAVSRESEAFYRVQTLQTGYQAGLRDGARCVAHKNCFTISSDLSYFVTSLTK